MNLYIYKEKSATLTHDGEGSRVDLQFNVGTKRSQEPDILLFFNFTKCYLCQWQGKGKAWGKIDTIQLISNLRTSTLCTDHYIIRK